MIFIWCNLKKPMTLVEGSIIFLNEEKLEIGQGQTWKCNVSLILFFLRIFVQGR